MTDYAPLPSRSAFLNHLFYDVAGFFELTFIAPPGVDVSGPRIFTDSYKLGVERPDWERVDRLNAGGYGVYYGLTPKRQRVTPYARSKETDAGCCQVLWIDADLAEGTYPDKDAAYVAICDLFPPATVIIDSGGGLHALWRISPLLNTPDNIKAIKRTLKGLALAAKSDLHVADLARVFRLPGTVNTKPARQGARCEVLDWLPGELSFDAFEEYRALVPDWTRPAITRPLPHEARLSLPRWVLDYLTSGAAQGTRNSRLFAAAIEYRVNGYIMTDARRELGGRAALDGLSDREIERTITSAWDSPHGALNVAPHIAMRIAAQELTE